jgi:hypothetical protein
VVSILLALAVDGMRDNRHNRNLARQSLEIFQGELCANRARVEDALPYHTGLRDVVMEIADDPERAGEVRSMVEGLEPPLLLNTAWEAALATGALTHMEMTTVSALSLTYSMQDRYMAGASEGGPRLLLLPGTTSREQLAQAQQALTYLTELVRSEQRLQAVYNEAIEVAEVAKQSMPARIGGSPRAAVMASPADTTVTLCDRLGPSSIAPAVDSARP